MSYRTVPWTRAGEARAAGLGIPLLVGPVIGLTSLLDHYFPTDEEDAKRELEKYQDPAQTPGPPVDPTIWVPLAGLLATTAVVYYLSTSSEASTPRRRRR